MSKNNLNKIIYYLMDSKLFTPGPLTTSMTVKRAMLYDMGSRDDEFLSIISNIRIILTNIACYRSNKINEYTSVLMQGSGTFTVESVLNSCIPKRDNSSKFLVIINGKYAERMKKIAEKLEIVVEVLEYSETDKIKLDDLKEVLEKDKNIKYVGMIHHETSTGQLNNISEVGNFLKDKNITFIVDSMSAFGAVEFDIYEDNVDFLVSSANKCIEGVPGFAFAVCNKEKLLKCTYSTSLSLDLLDQWKNLEKSGQFRFTPPTHTILAFHKALLEYEEEGGLDSRMNRYKENHKILQEGMTDLGFTSFLPLDMQGYFITSFLYLNDNFNFNDFYNYLKNNGLIIYPGKTTNIPSFRIGNIGKLYKNDIEKLLDQVKIYINKM